LASSATCGCRLCAAPDAGNESVAALRVDVAVSACRESLDWLPSALASLNVSRVTAYSKCNQSAAALGGAVEVPLANVGRCDHTYAHHLGRVAAAEPADVYLFVKDTRLVHQLGVANDLADVVQLAARAGFACGQRPAGELSAWHASRDLLGLKKTGYSSPGAHDSHASFAAPFASMRDWVASLRPAWPEGVSRLEQAPLWPVCYGAVFAASRASVERVPAAFWAALEASLSRDDNIEEGHYAERLWAATLSPPPPAGDEAALAASAECKIGEYLRGYLGTLIGCRK